MNRETIIQMACEHGLLPSWYTPKQDAEKIERFAAAIRAATKEEDARICDSKADEDLYGPFWNSSAGRAANICAQAIRDSK